MMTTPRLFTFAAGAAFGICGAIALAGLAPIRAQSTGRTWTPAGSGVFGTQGVAAFLISNDGRIKICRSTSGTQPACSPSEPIGS